MDRFTNDSNICAGCPYQYIDGSCGWTTQDPAPDCVFTDWQGRDDNDD